MCLFGGHSEMVIHIERLSYKNYPLNNRFTDHKKSTLEVRKTFELEGVPSNRVNIERLPAYGGKTLPPFASLFSSFLSPSVSTSRGSAYGAN
jgi:hypothetical protein